MSFLAEIPAVHVEISVNVTIVTEEVINKTTVTTDHSVVETTVSYNETEINVNITEIEEFINKTTITTHQVAPTGKTAGNNSVNLPWLTFIFIILIKLNTIFNLIKQYSKVSNVFLSTFLIFSPVGPTVPPVDGSGSATHSASGEISGDGESGFTSGSGDPIGQEGKGESETIFISGAEGSASGSGEGFNREHSGFGVSGSGSGVISGSGDISGSGGDSMIIMVDGEMVEVPKLPKPIEEELGQGGIDTSGTSTSGSEDMSGSGGTSASGGMSASGGTSASGATSGSGGMPESGSGGFSGISFIDHSGIDLTVQQSGEQEMSGYSAIGSGFPSGFPSGFTSGVSGSGSASGDSFQHQGGIIYLTDTDMMEVTVPPLVRQPEQGRGVVEISGQGSGSGITYTEYINSLGQSGQEESQESRAGPTVYVVTPDSAYTSPTTAPAVSFETPAVVQQPDVVEGMLFNCLLCHSFKLYQETRNIFNII